MICTPAGFTATPLADSDLDDVVDSVRACGLHDSRESMVARADLVADPASDPMDRARDPLVIRSATVGRRAMALCTDSDTGALPCHERPGMRVSRSFTHWATPMGGAGRA